ncbi:MAG: class I SAM-dependent methyltransferase [Gemmatimonadales bacterium]
MTQDARFQRRIQRYGWDKAVAHYERFWAGQLKPAQDRLLELAALRPGERVLDVACGTGLVTFRAAAQVSPGGAVLATDLSDEMVKSLRETAAERGFTNITAERMDAEEPTVPEASFDVALCALGLMYVPDPRKALEAMRRALRPPLPGPPTGGRAAVAVWGARSRCGWAEIFPIVERRVASEVCPLFFQLGQGDGLAITMELAGFGDLMVDRLVTTLRYDSGEDACGAAFAGGPVALAYSRFDQPTRVEAHAEYLTSIEPFRRGDGYEIPGEFVVARGLRVE